MNCKSINTIANMPAKYQLETGASVSAVEKSTSLTMTGGILPEYREINPPFGDC
jgi:hypothetical protein